MWLVIITTFSQFFAITKVVVWFLQFSPNNTNKLYSKICNLLKWNKDCSNYFVRYYTGMPKDLKHYVVTYVYLETFFLSFHSKSWYRLFFFYHLYALCGRIFCCMINCDCTVSVVLWRLQFIFFRNELMDRILEWKKNFNFVPRQWSWMIVLEKVESQRFPIISKKM